MTAEVALAAADGMHRRGVATLLLEHLVSLARACGVQTFIAEVLADNYAVLRLLGDSGLVLHLESFGNPRRFAQVARRVGARIPILTVHAGRSAPEQRAAVSRTAAAVAPLITRQALFEQAGIIATTSFGELLDTAVLMSSQPLPAGFTVAIVSNGGGAGALAADACADAGLAVALTSEPARHRLRQVLPAAASVDGPVDTTAAVSPRAFAEALRITAAEEGVAALIAVLVQSASPGLLRAARYGTWRLRSPGTVPEFTDVRAGLAGSIVASFLARMPGGGWLSAEEADGVLRCYGLPMVEFRRVADADAAVMAAAGLGGHVALKADVPGLLHKTVEGAVELDLHGADEVRAAMGRLQARFAGRMSGVLVEPMITGGIETLAGVVQEPVFGPVLVFGLGGIATGVLDGHAARLAPSDRRLASFSRNRNKPGT